MIYPAHAKEAISSSRSSFSGFWLLASGFWLLASGFWLLASGFWLLASGFWLLASGFGVTQAQAAGIPPFPEDSFIAPQSVLSLLENTDRKGTLTEISVSLKLPKIFQKLIVVANIDRTPVEDRTLQFSCHWHLIDGEVDVPENARQKEMGRNNFFFDCHLEKKTPERDSALNQKELAELEDFDQVEMPLILRALDEILSTHLTDLKLSSVLKLHAKSIFDENGFEEKVNIQLNGETRVGRVKKKTKFSFDCEPIEEKIKCAQ